MTKKISILGCGWLGIPLAKTLLANDFSVNGSTTSNEKIPILENLGINAFLMALHENEITGNISAFLKNAALLIIDIPPKLRGAGSENFVSKINTLIPFIERSGVRTVLFVSSISVYADSDTVISEATVPNPDSENGMQLWAAEKLLQNNSNFQATVLRFGGLIGEERHPIKYLAGKKGLENPDAPINLIHQKDCVGIILKIIEKEMWNETFNATTPFHPTRKEYYTQKAVALNLVLPEFDASKPSNGKTISGEKIKTVLGYTFVEPEL